MELNPAPIRPERTIIVSGLARSGTSMVAGVLHHAGLYLGSELDGVVREDLAIARLLGTDRLAALVAERNRVLPLWGFKRPNLHAFGPGIVRAFRNPRVILTSRDPLAVARRDMLSEHHAEEFAAGKLQAAATETLASAMFAITLPCPVLLVSYERALLDPGRAARAILAFAGLKGDAAAIGQTIQPDKPQYLTQTERLFRGHLDGVFDHVLHGWAAEPGSAEPLRLDLLIDGELRMSFLANDLRLDLAEQGFGSGYHGFKIPLPPGAARATQIAVRVAGRTYVLQGSGQTVAALSTPG